jgi:catechol 2,3-dioxygenase-like lactoylglutathione lyase family enzyme
MIRIRQIDHVVLRVVDLDAMTAFYCEVLGCSVERRQDEIGLVQLRAGSALVDLVPVDGKLGREGGAPPGIEGRNVDHVCFRVEPFDAAAIRAHLGRHGVAAGLTAVIKCLPACAGTTRRIGPVTGQPHPSHPH